MQLILLFGCVSILAFVKARQLIQGNLIWRHGDRSSRHTYPNDPHKGVWKDGIMQITEKGLAQEYDLGLFLREKYGHLISKKYKEGEIFIKSTDRDRSIMSAQSITAALYAPTNITKWKGRYSYWRPFPIHVDSLSNDWLYTVQKYPEKGCEEFTKLLNKSNTDSNWYKETNLKYKKLFSDLNKYTGTVEPYDAYNTGALRDNLYCLQQNGFEIPTWADEKVMKILIYLSGVNQGLEYSDYKMEFTKLMSKMKTGVILEHMYESMKKRVKNETQLSIIGYSAHDSTVTPLLMSLGAFNWVLPPYASCAMIDLYIEDDQSYSVEFWYRNDSTREPYPLSFYECGTSCSFEKFEEVAKTVMTGNHTASLCGLQSGESCCVYLFIGITVVILCVTLFSAIHCWFHKKQRKKEPYTKLAQEESEVIGFETTAS